MNLTTKIALAGLVAGLAACQPGASPQPMDMSGLIGSGNRTNQNNAAATAVSPAAQAAAAQAASNTSASSLRDAARAASGANTNLGTPTLSPSAIQQVQQSIPNIPTPSIGN
jgi:hypothetical protein